MLTAHIFSLFLVSDLNIECITNPVYAHETHVLITSP